MILWLTGRYPYSLGTKAIFLNALHANGVNSTDIVFTSLHAKVPDLHVYPKQGIPAKVLIRAVKHSLSQHIQALHPKLIVVNDEATLRCLTEKPYTLSQTRSSVYFFEGVPVLILDNVNNIHRMNHGKWMFGLDLAKVVRYAKGQQKQEPAFNFVLCRTVAEVRSHCELAKQATLVATDTETALGTITVVSFTYDHAGKLVTFCCPFFDPWKAEGAYWSFADECTVRGLIGELLASDVPKTLHNGMYDLAYFIECGWWVNNYLYDSQYLMHSIWIEAPKALHNVSSYFLDNYTYWKDDAKGVQEDGWGKSPEDIEVYWVYNGRDTYYTWLSTRELLSRIVKLPWALKNYNNTLRLAVGPCLAASLRGVNVDQGRHSYIMAQKREDVAKGLENVRALTCEPTFNPKSTEHCAWFLYDFCGIKPTRLQMGKRPKYNKRSTDEKVLKLMKEQNNFLATEFIERLLKARKPMSVLSNFGNIQKLCRNGRFLSWLNPSATKTFRFNSTKSQFWTGRNAQNIQAVLREFITADPDYVLVDIDYSASDDRYIAYECEDPIKIETVEGSKGDSHCYHCSVFFSKPYEDIERGWKNDEGWVVNEPEGLRQITKKITHGRNYREEAGTMYNLMGRDAVVATAVALGNPKAEGWSDKELTAVCGTLIDKYDHPTKGLYKRIRPWQDEIVALLKKNAGLMTNAFGLTRKFFAPTEDKGLQRQLAAQYGQSNTAGNVNRSLNHIFYSGIDDGVRCLALLQVHDSVVFAVHRHHLHLIGDIVRIMEEPVEIHGRMMRVPASPKVGLTWAKQMLSWKEGMTYQDVVDFENHGNVARGGKFEGFAKKYKNKEVNGLQDDIMKMMDNMDFSGFDDGDETIPEDGEQLEVTVEENAEEEMEDA